MGPCGCWVCYAHDVHMLCCAKLGCRFMAPELLAGRLCTAAADIFSFGVLIWALLTGEQVGAAWVVAAFHVV